MSTIACVRKWKIALHATFEREYVHSCMLPRIGKRTLHFPPNDVCEAAWRRCGRALLLWLAWRFVIRNEMISSIECGGKVKPFSSCFVAEMLTAELFVEGADLGRDTLTSHERAYARFQIVLVLGKEVWSYAIHTRDGRRSFCVWVVFLAKTGGTLSWSAALICSAVVCLLIVWKLFM